MIFVFQLTWSIVPGNTRGLFMCCLEGNHHRFGVRECSQKVTMSVGNCYNLNVYYQFSDNIVQELDTRFSHHHSGLMSAHALVPCKLDQLTSTCINSIKGYYSKFLGREENLDVEIDKWTTFCTKFQWIPGLKMFAQL